MYNDKFRLVVKNKNNIMCGKNIILGILQHVPVKVVIMQEVLLVISNYMR